MLLIEVVPVEKMAALIARFYDVSHVGHWGMAIKEVLESGDIRQLTRLINEMREQGKDCPELVINMVGEDCFNALMAL